jgi:hypothetical protein
LVTSRGETAVSNEPTNPKNIKKQHTLNDEQIRDLVAESQDEYAEVLEEAKRLLADIPSSGGHADVSVPVESLRRISKAVLALYKAISPVQPDVRMRPTRGDRGSGCDYNPFKGIDF